MTSSLARPPADARSGAGTGTQAIGRTFAVLELFRDRGGDLGISEIANTLGLSASTVHRIVRALADRGYLAQHQANERYYLGRSAVLLGHAASHGLGLDLAQSVLERLSEVSGESVNLGVRDADEMVVVIRAESRQPLRFSQDPGSRLPVHASAMGKLTLSLAGSIEDEIGALPAPLRALTTKTITSPARLRRELESIRRRGFSIDDEEAIPGVRCLAVPVHAPDGGAVAALGVQGPAVRMTRSRIKDLAPAAHRAAAEIAQLLPSAHRL